MRWLQPTQGDIETNPSPIWYPSPIWHPILLSGTTSSPYLVPHPRKGETPPPQGRTG